MTIEQLIDGAMRPVADAVSGTGGTGNIAGVGVAISTGGPSVSTSPRPQSDCGSVLASSTSPWTMCPAVSTIRLPRCADSVRTLFGTAPPVRCPNNYFIL